MNDIRYAAYGSNLHPLRLAGRVPGARLLGTAELPGYRLAFHKRSADGSGKCNIVRASGSVHLAVYAVSAGGRAELDQLEGTTFGYTSTSLDVPGFGSCFSYIANAAAIDDRLKPYTWYKALVLAGCEYHCFPAGYQAKIKSQAAIADPDLDRAARHGQIIFG